MGSHGGDYSSVVRDTTMAGMTYDQGFPFGEQCRLIGKKAKQSFDATDLNLTFSGRQAESI